jgi:bifunctional non-homologous end joining protein LigD
VADPLDPYRRKRDFAATPEPGPGEAEPPAGPLPRFVVQEHSARSMHWDLRLERAGVLASWAVPRGIPPDPERNHLAVRTEDHPLEYLTFEGTIPEGNYGAGTMKVFDTGTYETHKFSDREVMVTFHGERVHGRYVLFRTRGKDWMIHRMDPPEDPGYAPLPERIEPMLASAGKLPPEDGRWAFEIKWDGVRAIGYGEGGRLRLESRNGNDITPRYPELRDLGRALGTHEVVLDGEIVAFDADGCPSFQRLQSRMHLASEHAVRRKSQTEPVVFVLFDLLHLDGRSLLREPYEARREALAGLGLAGPAWQAPSHHVGDGAALLELARARGLEGVVAKRLDCPYTPGRRSPGWIKVKNVRRASLVIGGWLAGEGGRSGRLGALLVGFHEDGVLRYAGRVGTGFTEAELARVGELLAARTRPSSPFAGRQPPKLARFVEPDLVCEVEYTEWTQARTVRHPSYKGIRDDLDAADIGFPDDV